MTIDEAEKIKTVVENKDYIVQLVNTVAKAMIEAFENLKIEDVNMFQLGYNKAIDDFAERLKTDYVNFDLYYILQDNNFAFENTSLKSYQDMIDEIAEQLKAGGDNEQNI